MRANILLIVGIVLFVAASVLTTIYLKGYYDEQKQDLLKSLPEIPAPEAASGITIRIEKDGSCSLDGEPIAVEEIAARFQFLKQQGQTLRVTVEMEENAPKSAASAVLDACAAAGISDVSPTSPAPADAP